MADKSYERIVIKDSSGDSKLTLERPVFGDLIMKTDGSRTIVQKTGLFGNTTTYLLSDTDSVEAESWD